MTKARLFHLATFLMTAFALVLQFVLIVKGHGAVEVTPQPSPSVPDGTVVGNGYCDCGPDLATRIVRFVSYLTIWSNALVAWSTFTLALGFDRDSRVWRALRLNAIVICFGGGIVHFFFLRPLLDLHGSDLLADKLLHMIVPLLAVIGWVVFGPRGRATRADLVPFLVVPVFWLGYTIVRGAFVDWYPYPFSDVGLHGYGVVALNSVGISAFMVALAFLAIAVDRKLAER